MRVKIYTDSLYPVYGVAISGRDPEIEMSGEELSHMQQCFQEWEQWQEILEARLKVKSNAGAKPAA